MSGSCFLLTTMTETINSHSDTKSFATDLSASLAGALSCSKVENVRLTRNCSCTMRTLASQFVSRWLYSFSSCGHNSGSHFSDYQYNEQFSRAAHYIPDAFISSAGPRAWNSRPKSLRALVLACSDATPSAILPRVAAVSATHFGDTPFNLSSAPIPIASRALRTLYQKSAA